MQRVKSFLTVKKKEIKKKKENWESSKAYVSQISKKWKTRFQEEKCRRCSVRTEVQDKLPAYPTLGTDGAGSSSLSCLPHNCF